MGNDLAREAVTAVTWGGRGIQLLIASAPALFDNTYLNISDKMIEQASKETIAETARIQALHLAHYRAKHGEIPLNKSFELLLTGTLSDEQAGELADGFEVLIAVVKTLEMPAEGAQ